MYVAPSQDAIYTGVFSIDPVLENAENFGARFGQMPGIVHTHADWIQPVMEGDAQPNYMNWDGSGESTLLSLSDTNWELGDKSILDLATSLSSQGSVLAVSWNPMVIDYADPDYYYGTKMPTITFSDILNGQLDDYIRAAAAEATAYGDPLMMGLFGEVNAASLFGYGADGNTYLEMVDDTTGFYGDPTVDDAAERVRDTYKHVIDIFREEGADNVSWYMYMSTDYMVTDHPVHPSAFYPGDDYIDWVGQSAYVNNAGDLTTALDAGYKAWGEVTDKPFFIPELGLMDGSTDRAGDIADIMAQLSTYDRLKALTWVDFGGAEAFFGTPRLGTTEGEWEAMKAATGYTTDVMIDTGSEMVSFAEMMGLTEPEAPADEPVDEPADPTATETQIVGTDESEELYNTTGAQWMDGGAGDDAVIGSDQGEYIDGGAGNDHLMGMGGNDALRGGEGADTFYVTHNQGLDLILDFDSTEGDTIDLTYAGYNSTSEALANMVMQETEDGMFISFGDNANLLLQGVDAVDTAWFSGPADDTGGQTGTENPAEEPPAEEPPAEEPSPAVDTTGNQIVGTDESEELYNTTGAQFMDGGAGDDAVIGSDQGEYIDGGAGNDHLMGMGGNDALRGGEGADTFYVTYKQGLDKILDFNAAEGDRIDLTYMGFSSIAEAREAVVTQATEEGMFIAFNDGSSLLIDGVSSLEADWFIA